MSTTLRPQQQGRMLPGWLDTRHPEAERGTTRLRTVDTNLIVGWDRRQQVFQVWGPSISAGGWVPICVCQDDHGRPFRGSVPWPLIIAALISARDGELSCDAANRHNERLQSSRDASDADGVLEGARYYAKAVAGEAEGWGRWDAQEVEDAYLMAKNGSSKAAPRGRKHFS